MHPGFRTRCDSPPVGFTLIEMLIVVAIIAILAAIVLPNFLEAQTRARVSRVRADFHAATTAIESYWTDWNAYPMNDGVFNILPIGLSTPIAYLASNRLVDPFSDKELHPVYGELARFYTYTETVDLETAMQRSEMGCAAPPEAIDHPFFNEGAFHKYGRWRLVSNGPDRSYADPDATFGDDPIDPMNLLRGADIPYDPTNGTISKGNILRTQKSPTGRISRP